MGSWVASVWSPERPSETRSLDLPVPPPLTGRGEGLEGELIDQPEGRSPLRTPSVVGVEGFLVSEHIHELETIRASSMGTEVPAAGTLPDLALGASSSVSFVISLVVNWST